MQRIAFAALVLALTTPVLAKNAVTIKFEESAVVATVTPGASTAWFAISHEVGADGLRVRNGAYIVADDDRDGVVRTPLTKGVPQTSFWMVVDMDSGEYAIESPGGGIAGHRRALPPSALKSKDKGAKAGLQHLLPRMTVLVVRPGVGAWFGRIDDGSRDDSDGVADGNVTSLIDQLKAVGSAPPAPDDFERGDVVAFVEPMSFTIFDGRVVK